MSPNDKLVLRAFANLSARLRAERERKGLSMLALSERAGLSQHMVSYIERGKRNPSLDSLIRLCGALELDAGAVLSEALGKR